METQVISLKSINIEIHQCAWCLAIADSRGEYTIRSDRLVDGTHGCCPPCAENWLRATRAEHARRAALHSAAELAQAA